MTNPPLRDEIIAILENHPEGMSAKALYFALVKNGVDGGSPDGANIAGILRRLRNRGVVRSEEGRGLPARHPKTRRWFTPKVVHWFHVPNNQRAQPSLILPPKT